MASFAFDASANATTFAQRLNATNTVFINPSVAGASASNALTVRGTGTGQGLAVAYSGTSNAVQISSGIETNALVVSANGLVGLGTAAPIQRAHIQGSAYISGSCGIGTTSPATTLHIVGNATVAGGLAVGETSEGLVGLVQFNQHLYSEAGTAGVLGVPVISGGSSTGIAYNTAGRDGTSAVFINAPGGAPAVAVSYELLRPLFPALPATGGGSGADSGLSISCWVKISDSAPSGNQTIFAAEGGFGVNNAPTTGSAIVQCYIEAGTNLFRAAFQTTSGNYATAAPAAPTCVVGTWFHVALVFNAGAMQLYVNGAAAGAPVAYTTATATAATAPVLRTVHLAQPYASPVSGALDGELDLFRVWTRPLTAAEVLRQATTFTASQPGLTVSSGRLNGPLQLSADSALTVLPASSNATTAQAAGASTLALSGASTRIVDTTGNFPYPTDAFNGNVSVAPAFSPFAGSDEGSLYFNNIAGSGSNCAHILFANSNVFTGQGAWGTSGMTLEAWIYPTGRDAAKITPILGHPAIPFTGGPFYLLSMTAAGILQFYYYNNGTNPTITSSATIPLNTWSHVAMSCDPGGSGTIRLFYNGALVGSAALSGTPSVEFTSGLFNIGQINPSTYAGFQGYMTNIRYVQGAAVYTAAFTPATAPLTAATTGATVLLLRVPRAEKPTISFGGADSRIVAPKIGGPADIQGDFRFPPVGMVSQVMSVVPQGSTISPADSARTAVVAPGTIGLGTYIAHSSTQLTESVPAWRVFNRVAGDSWACSSNQYGSDGTYSGSTITADITNTWYNGEWVQLQLPLPIVLTRVELTGLATQPTKFPRVFTILGSVNSVQWKVISQYSQVGFSAATQTFPVQNNRQAFTYYRLVVAQVSGNGGLADFSEWAIYGRPDSINIDGDGRVGIGTVANPAQALTVSGNMAISGNISAGNLGMFRNRIINGDMRIAQRGTSSTSADYGTVDRFRTNGSITTGTITQTQQTLASQDTPYRYGFRNSMRFTATVACTNYSYIEPSHLIEGLNFADMNWGTAFGHPITISFWFRANWNGPTHLSLRTYSTNYAYIAPFTAVNNTWLYLTFTIPPPPSGITVSTDNTLALFLTICPVLNNGFGTQTLTNTWIFNAGVVLTTTTNWPATLNRYVEFTGLQLEKGTLATPFEFRPYATELALCQRYYELVGTTSLTGMIISANATVSSLTYITPKRNTTSQLITLVDSVQITRPGIAAYSISATNGTVTTQAYTLTGASFNINDTTQTFNVGQFVAWNTNKSPFAVSCEL